MRPRSGRGEHSVAGYARTWERETGDAIHLMANAEEERTCSKYSKVRTFKDLEGLLQAS